MILELFYVCSRFLHASITCTSEGHLGCRKKIESSMQIKCGQTISDLGLNIIPAGPQIEFESAHLISKTNKTVRLSPGPNSNDQIHPTLWNRLDDLVIPMQCTETFCLRVPIQCKMCHQVAVVCILRRGCQPLGTIHMLCVPRTSQHARTPHRNRTTLAVFFPARIQARPICSSTQDFRIPAGAANTRRSVS